MDSGKNIGSYLPTISPGCGFRCFFFIFQVLRISKHFPQVFIHVQPHFKVNTCMLVIGGYTISLFLAICQTIKNVFTTFHPISPKFNLWGPLFATTGRPVVCHNGIQVNISLVISYKKYGTLKFKHGSQMENPQMYILKTADRRAKLVVIRTASM